MGSCGPVTQSPVLEEGQNLAKDDSGLLQKLLLLLLCPTRIKQGQFLVQLSYFSTLAVKSLIQSFKSRPMCMLKSSPFVLTCPFHEQSR